MWQFLLHNLSNNTQPIFVTHATYRHLGSLVGQYVWDLWWTEWHWARFFSECFDFFPVSNNLPMLHTILFSWHWRCMILAAVSVMKWSAPVSCKNKAENFQNLKLHKKLITSKIYCAADRYLSNVNNWLSISWQSTALQQLSLFGIWIRVVLHIHLTYLSNE